MGKNSRRLGNSRKFIISIFILIALLIAPTTKAYPEKFLNYYNINTPNNDVKFYANGNSKGTPYHFPAIDIQQLYYSFQNNIFTVKLKMGATPIIDNNTEYFFNMDLAINDSCGFFVNAGKSLINPIANILIIGISVETSNFKESHANVNTTLHVDGDYVSWNINFTQFYPLINVKNLFVPYNLKNLSNSSYTGFPFSSVSVTHSLILSGQAGFLQDYFSPSGSYNVIDIYYWSIGSVFLLIAIGSGLAYRNHRKKKKLARKSNLDEYLSNYHEEK